MAKDAFARITQDQIIDQLALEPHPEGGWYRRTYTSKEVFQTENGDMRSLASGILFLVPGTVTTRWHRLDADELWHHLAGGTLLLETKTTIASDIKTKRLGMDLAAGDIPQQLIEKQIWQRCCLADPDPGTWCLIGCSVVPAFSFDGFEMSPTEKTL